LADKPKDGGRLSPGARRGIVRAIFKRKWLRREREE